ncbi:hypothetical protein B7463_g4853, partial [Scytalidium lignicola]
MTFIQYGSLNPQKREISLFTLLARESHSLTMKSKNLHGNGGDDISSNGNRIQGILETLSYTWVNETPSTTIQVDSQTIMVRENLDAALRYIQQLHRPVTICIDAICIYQTNDTEKSHHVQMMCEIYHKAAEVLVWVRLAKDDSDNAMEKFESIGKKAIEAGMQDFRATDMEKWFDPGGDEREISLTRSLTILCGSNRLPFTLFAAASNFCAFARWTLSTRVTNADWQDPVTGRLLRSVSGHAPSSAPNVLTGARRRYNLEIGEE